MKKTEVNICDDCRRVIANKRCEICDGDICEDCEDDMGVGLANGGILFLIMSCKKCSKKLEGAKLKKYFEEDPHREIRKGIVNIFRNAIVVENLQDNDDKEADREWMINKIRQDDTYVGDGRIKPRSPFKKFKPFSSVNSASMYVKK